MTRSPLYILTDANGFTTCCAATRDAMVEEACRAHLQGSITVVSWTPVTFDPNRHTHLPGWRKLDEWVWKAGRP